VLGVGGRERAGTGLAVAGDGPALAGAPALVCLRSDFSRFKLFREILRKLFVDLGANWKRKSSIPAKKQGIGARKFVEI
jgi:hypothetical protein